MIPSILEDLSDEELKREAKNESKNDVISTIIRSCRHLLSKVPSQEEKMKEFEMFRLKMLLRCDPISEISESLFKILDISTKLFFDADYYKYHLSMEK